MNSWIIKNLAKKKNATAGALNVTDAYQRGLQRPLAAALDGPPDAAGDLDGPNLRLRGKRLVGGVGERDDHTSLALADDGVAAELAPRPPRPLFGTKLKCNVLRDRNVMA